MTLLTLSALAPRVRGTGDTTSVDATPKGTAAHEIVLRPETPLDEPLLVALFRSTRASGLAFLAGDEVAREALIRRQHLAQKHAHDATYPGARRSIILAGGVAVGRLVVDRTSREIRVVDVVLLPEHRGRGVGTAILRALLAEAGESGRLVGLHLARDNPAARLVQRLGFVRIGQTPMYDALEWRPRGMTNGSLPPPR